MTADACGRLGSGQLPEHRDDAVVRGDLTRLLSAVRRFVAVLLQQGRVQLDADSDEDYTRLRRFLVFAEESVAAALRWVGFEPDGDRWRGWRSRRRRRAR